VRGDVIEELDWCVGQITAALDRLKLVGDTLIMFTSDNGPIVNDGYADGAVEQLNGHKPASPWRGGKYTPYEGGTRVPLIVSWPGRVKPGVSEALVSQVDLLASFAALAGQKIPGQAGPDSFNVLPALLGEAGARGRQTLIEQGGGGGVAVRRGPWKLIPRNAGPQVFNLNDDPAETKNVAEDHPDVLNELRAVLRQARERGRTRVEQR
jgi:arylsulfatase A-like enzyme